VRASVGVIRRLGNQPLFLAQGCSSAAGAIAMVMAAVVMSPRDFTTFSLLILVSVTAMGAIRAGLFQPALIETRSDKDAHVHVGTATLGAAGAAVLPVIAAVLLGITAPGWLVAIGLTSTLPVLAEWLRIRGMALDRRWDVANSDVFRLVATLLGPLVLWVTADVGVFFLFVNLTYVTSVTYLWFRLPTVSKHISPRRFWRPASSQLADYLIGQAVSTLPLLILGSLGPSAYIGGVRLAQTLLGPLNLIFAASTVNLLSDGATRQSHSDDGDLIYRSRKLARLLGVFSVVLVAVLLGILVLSGFGFRGVDNRSLIVGVALVGVLAVVSGFAGIDAIVMRLLGYHAIPTIGRAVLVIVTFCGYAAGYVMGGVDASLILGFSVAAVANPIAFVLPATAVYRRHSARPGVAKPHAELTIPS
jgi:hypothetical protein